MHRRASTVSLMPVDLETRRRGLQQVARRLGEVAIEERKAEQKNLRDDYLAGLEVHDPLVACLSSIHSLRDVAQDHTGLPAHKWPRTRLTQYRNVSLEGLVWVRNLQHHEQHQIFDISFLEPGPLTHVVWAARRQFPEQPPDLDKLPAKRAAHAKMIFSQGAEAYQGRLEHDHVTRALFAAADLLQDQLDLRGEQIVPSPMIKSIVIDRYDARGFFRQQFFHHHYPAFVRQPLTPDPFLRTVHLSGALPPGRTRIIRERPSA